MLKTYTEHISISEWEAKEIIGKALGCDPSDVTIEASYNEYTGKTDVYISADKQVAEDR